MSSHIELSPPPRILSLSADQTRAIADSAELREALGRSARKRGELHMIEKVDDSGRKIREFVGSKSAWMDPYKSPAQLQTRIRKDFPNGVKLRGQVIDCSPQTGLPVNPYHLRGY